MNKLEKSAEILTSKCLNLKPTEKALIIYDETTKEIAEEIFKKASKKAETMMVRTNPTARHGAEPSKEIAYLMKKFDVVIAPTRYSLTHTKARQNATRKGARVITMPGITPKIFEKTIDIDYKKLDEEIKKIGKKMKKAKTVKVISANGTEFEFKNEGKRAREEDNGLFLKKGSYGNLPAGEIYVAPIEKTGKGIVVIDSMEGICKPRTKLLIKKGLVQEVEGDNEFRKKLWSLKNARNIAEFGIGLNPKATIIGNTLEDEKVKGTCHIALGSNFDFGGKVKAEVHWDGIIIAPSIWFDNEKIMDKGELLI